MCLRPPGDPANKCSRKVHNAKREEAKPGTLGDPGLHEPLAEAQGVDGRLDRRWHTPEELKAFEDRQQVERESTARDLEAALGAVRKGMPSFKPSASLVEIAFLTSATACTATAGDPVLIVNDHNLTPPTGKPQSHKSTSMVAGASLGVHNPSLHNVANGPSTSGYGLL